MLNVVWICLNGNYHTLYCASNFMDNAFFLHMLPLRTNFRWTSLRRTSLPWTQRLSANSDMCSACHWRTTAWSICLRASSKAGSFERRWSKNISAKASGSHAMTQCVMFIQQPYIELMFQVYHHWSSWTWHELSWKHCTKILFGA